MRFVKGEGRGVRRERKDRGDREEGGEDGEGRGREEGGRRVEKHDES